MICRLMISLPAGKYSLVVDLTRRWNCQICSGFVSTVLHKPKRKLKRKCVISFCIAVPYRRNRKQYVKEATPVL